VKPFQNAGQYTVFENAILDTIMPMCSPNEWKILCVAIRKTVGWHKQEDAISITQFQKLAGVSRPTAIKAIEEAVNHGFLIRKPKGQTFTYHLNREYETSKESLPATSKESLPTKETIKQKDLKDSEAPENPVPEQNKPAPEHTLMLEEMSRICGMDISLNAGRMAKRVSQLRKAKYTLEDLKRFEKWWYRKDWRGKKKQPPTPEQILENILKTKPAQPRQQSVTAYKNKSELEKKRRLQQQVRDAINSLENEQGRSATLQEVEAIQANIYVGEPA
jgi:hypothetical protein